MQALSQTDAAIAAQQLSKPTLILGSDHPDVAELQELLARYVSNPRVSGGRYDSLTEYAVRLFQYRMFLEEDGIVGPKTWRALYTGAPVDMPELSEGVRDAVVLVLQNTLSASGYGPSTGDNFYSGFVKRNVRLFQQRSGLADDGVVGARTWHALSKIRLEDPTSTFTSFRIANQEKLHANGITAMAITPLSPERALNVVTASRDTTVRFWRPDGEPAGPIYNGDRGAVSSVAFHPTRRQMISGTYGGTVRISNDTATTLSIFPARGGSVTDLAVDPAGQYIATANGDNAIRLFNLKGDLLREPVTARGASGSAESIDISVQGQLATASTLIGANIWNNPLDPSDQGANISSSRFANLVRFSPNGYKLAVTRGPLLQIYSNQRHVLAFTRCPAAITALAFSKTGRYLAMGCADSNIYFFDLQANNGAGERVFTLEGHTSRVTALAFLSEPRFAFYSGDASGRFLTWVVGMG